MAWDEHLFDLLDDLEGQAGSLFAAEREAELADRSRAEYATVTLAARLMASEGRQVSLDVVGAGRVTGELRRVGPGWCRVTDAGRDWLVPTAGVEGATGLSERAVPEVAWSPLARLGLGSALRRLADEALPCVLVTRSGARHEVLVLRVGQDFVEVEMETDADRPRRALLAMAAIGVVQSREVG